MFLQLWSQNPGPSCSGHDISLQEWQVPIQTSPQCQDGRSSFPAGSSLSPPIPPKPNSGQSLRGDALAPYHPPEQPTFQAGLLQPLHCLPLCGHRLRSGSGTQNSAVSHARAGVVPLLTSACPAPVSGVPFHLLPAFHFLQPTTVLCGSRPLKGLLCALLHSPSLAFLGRR